MPFMTFLMSVLLYSILCGELLLNWMENDKTEKQTSDLQPLKGSKILSVLQAKSQLNLGGSDTLSDLPPLQTPSPKCKRERSLSVNSYLLSPSHALSISPPNTPQNTKHSSLNPSPRNSPRNFSLPANKLYFFPSTFTTDLIPVSRRTSANSDNSSRTPLSSRTGSPTPNYSKGTSFYNFNRRFVYKLF